MNHKLRRDIEKLFGKPLVDPDVQDKTDWTPMCVPGDEDDDLPKTPTAWFAYNRSTRQSIEFASFTSASQFCFHPDNRR